MLVKLILIQKHNYSMIYINYINSSFLPKIYERLLYNNVFNFINEKELRYKYQFGFRQKHSTQQPIRSLVDKITKSLDSGDIVIGVFLGFQKCVCYCLHMVSVATY